MLASLLSISTLLSAIFAGCLLIVAIVAAGFTYRQLQAQARNTKLERVYALSDRCSDPEFMALMASAQAFFSLGPTAGKKRWRAMANARDKHPRTNILAVLNFLEEIAGEYRDGLLDKTVADRNVALVAVEAWGQAKWFAVWIRKTTGQDEAWKQLQTLADAWPSEPQT